MKKKIMGILAVSAAMTLFTSISSYAGWVKEERGWRYYYDSNTYAGCGWFTDPATGLEYHLNPDGYAMTETHVQGYYLDADGVKHEKSAKQIELEEKRKKREAARANPGKKVAAATAAAKAAQTGTMAQGTTRMVFQYEMKSFMNAIYKDLRVNNQNHSLGGHAKQEDNTATVYCFHNQDNREILLSTIWMIANKKNPDYREQAFELQYDTNILTEEADIALFTTAFNRFVTATLGDNTGAAMLGDAANELAAGSTSFQRQGNTDTGNSYTFTYKNGIYHISIICSEIEPAAPAEDAAATDEGDASQGGENTAANEETAAADSNSSIITVGQATREKAAANDTAAEGTGTAETEAAAETETTNDNSEQ